jgi:hypothetical protein
VDDRDVERVREVAGLIEPAPHSPPGMKRDRHGAVRIGEQLTRRRSQEQSEAAADRSASLVLERVDDLAQRAFIGAYSAAGIDRTGAPAAGGAL